MSSFVFKSNIQNILASEFKQKVESLGLTFEAKDMPGEYCDFRVIAENKERLLNFLKWWSGSDDVNLLFNELMLDGAIQEN